jgi:hypothetical protein
MPPTCPGCPCPSGCPRRPVFCEWAASGDEVLVRHVMHKGGCSGPAPVPRDAPPPGCRPSAPARELVVARYREDDGWLDRVPGDVAISCYEKSDAPPRATRPVRRVRLPNVGREAHTYATHIVRHYRDLAGWTYFAQADAVDVHAPDFVERLELPYSDTTTLTQHYRADWPPPAIKARDRVEEIAGYPVRYGNALARSATSYTPGWDPRRTQFFYPAAWPWVFACPMPDPLWFGYGAMYAVPRRRITDRPLGFWRWLLAEIERTPWATDDWLPDAPLTGWQLEAIWGYLFAASATYPHRPDRTLASPAEEGVRLARAMRACPYRSRGPGCGCSGANCSLRGGAVVSHIDCFDCLRRFA